MLTTTMPKNRRVTEAEVQPRRASGFRLNELERQRLHAIALHEERESDSDMVRVLISRAYRALPNAAKLPEDRAHDDSGR